MKFAALIEYVQDKEMVDAHRPAHRAYLTRLVQEGKLAASGPLTDGYGALIVYEAASADEALALLQADPFHAAGVFVRWDLRPWNVIFSNRELFPN